MERRGILRTLDADGKLDGLPFMPEMLSFCGQRYRVRARAHKACDTIDWQQFRRMESAVHLEELRCDGSSHGGCQAGCLLSGRKRGCAQSTRRKASGLRKPTPQELPWRH